MFDFKYRLVLHLLTVVSLMGGRADGCGNDNVSTCPFYTLVSQVTFIPIPDPLHLDTVCSQLQKGLRCLLRPSVLGKCDALTKSVFSSILNVLQFPCERDRSAYLSGQECWKSADLKNILKVCYHRHSASISTNYCTGQEQFVHCTIADILNVEHCGPTEQRVLTNMMVSSYNSNGLVMDPPCSELVIAEATTKPPPTTTTTKPNTTTTTSTTPTTSSSQSSTRQPATSEPSSKLTKMMTASTTMETKGREPTTSTLTEPSSAENKGEGMVTQASRGSGAVVRQAAVFSWLIIAGVVVFLYL